MEPGNTFGAYTLSRVMGRGSRATVWDVVEGSGGPHYALKVLDVHDDVARERLRAEHAVQSRFDHPNIVHVHDILEEDGVLALVSELVSGCDLRTYIDEHRPGREDALKVFAGILHGLSAAHDAGLVHRDLKPTNILMTAGSRSIPKIADFGVVKRKEEGAHKLTQQGAVLGTLRYMSPEQLMDASGVDRRADLFSAGCILFELLTHEKCFTGKHRVALVNAVRTGEHTPFPEGFDPELRDVIEWMIAAEPADRPSNAHEVLERLGLPERPAPELTVVLGADATEAAPTDNRIWIAAGVAALVVLVGLAAAAFLR
ncbi:MAG: serine/threonine protein kinase [Alphaproteobacteria bacterium]|nr:serine/threonine protein kinase [Alphaproteobacteria bacterium]